MKNLLLGISLLLTMNTYTQELSAYQQKKINKEMAILTEVMELSPKQEKKMLKAKQVQGLDAMRINNAIKQGILKENKPESRKTWDTHVQQFHNKVRGIVSDEQWNLWVVYNCSKCKKPATDDELQETLTLEQQKILEAQLPEKGLMKLNNVVTEMSKAMSLYPDQEQAIRVIKLRLALECHKLFKSTIDKAEKKVEFKKLNVAANIKIRKVTSDEQMTAWWDYWKAKKNQ